MSFPILSIIILAPIIGAILIMVLPKEEHKLIKIVAALSSFVSLILSVYIYVAYDAAQGGFQYLEEILWLEQFGISYSLGVDGLSIPMMLLTGLVIFTAIFASWTVDTRVKEFFAFLLVMVAGIFGVFAARDLFWFFIFYELVVIPTYVIIIVWGSTRKEYGAMKLTLYHAISSAFILISIISTYIYASNQLGFGTFDIQTLATVQYDPFFQKTIFLLMLIGFGILVPMWPMHTWAPDGHVASPAAVSMLLAGVVMKMGGYGLIRAALFFFPEGAIFWAPLIAVFCIINVLYGALIAMVQKDLKYVIGYSSVSHMGYLLLGVAAFNTISINGAVSQMFAHGIMTALFFALVGYIYDQVHTREIARLGGLAHQMPRVATAFFIAGLASLGLPGLHNFAAEFMIFVGTYNANQELINTGIFSVNMKLMAILAILGVVITAIYVLRVVQFVFFGPRKAEWDFAKDASGPAMVPIVVLISTLILFGVFPQLITGMINSGVEPIISHVAPVLGESLAKIGGKF